MNLTRIAVVDDHAATSERPELDRIDVPREMIHPHTPSEQVVDQCTRAEVLLMNKVVFDSDILGQFLRLRSIDVTATDHNIVDSVAAKERGIVVSQATDKSTMPVPRLIFALLLNLSPCVRNQSRNWFETDLSQRLARAANPIRKKEWSPEHSSWINEALETGRPYHGHFKLAQVACIATLLADAIIEAPGYVDKFGIHLTPVGELPMACAATCNASTNVKHMNVQAAVTGNALLLKLAVWHDPLTAAGCDPEHVWQMVDEMLVAQAQWLPQYRANAEVARVKKRLATSGAYRCRSGKEPPGCRRRPSPSCARPMRRACWLWTRPHPNRESCPEKMKNANEA